MLIFRWSFDQIPFSYVWPRYFRRVTSATAGETEQTHSSRSGCERAHREVTYFVSAKQFVSVSVLPSQHMG